MKQLFVLLGFLASLLALNDHALSQELLLPPQPQSIKISDGCYDLGESDNVTNSYPNLLEQKTNNYEQLIELFADSSLKWKNVGKAEIILELVEDRHADTPNHVDGYLLQIEEEGIHVSARSESGLNLISLT